jgi:hypothetical protein
MKISDAWRMIGQAFTRLVQSDFVEHAEQRKAALDLAVTFLTDEQRHDFMVATGDSPRSRK